MAFFIGFFNMIFLWIFGLIVEGSGWWKFLLIFFGAGIAQCALEEMVRHFCRPNQRMSLVLFRMFRLALQALFMHLSPQRLSGRLKMILMACCSFSVSVM